MTEFSPARAYWNQRSVLAGARNRILALRHAVGHGSDLVPFQWAQLMSVAMEFQPDIILELGRGRGNSTVAFAEAASLSGGETQILSICMSSDWERITLPGIRPLVTDKWLSQVHAITGNILAFDYQSALRSAKRVLVFWDAHGFDVADCVLGSIMPILSTKQHLVVMHDMSDSRYIPGEFFDYDGQGLWKGNNWSGPRLKLGNIDSAVEQSIAAVDFTTRNRLTLESADHSYHTGLTSAQQVEMQRALGDLFNLNGHWFYFSMNEHPGPYRFPRFGLPLDIVIPVGGQSEDLLPLLETLNSQVKTCCSVLVCYDSGDHTAPTALKTQSFTNLAIRMVSSPGATPRDAALAGFRASSAPAVLLLPAEGVDNPSIIDFMSSQIGSGCDIVCGSRFIRGGSMSGYPWLQSLLLRVTAFTLYALGRLPVHDPTNRFQMYSRRVLDQIAVESTDGFAFSLELLVKCHRLNWKIAEAPVISIAKRRRQGRPRIVELSRAYLKWRFYAFVTSYFPSRAKPVN